jgi:hypothetical protein
MISPMPVWSTRRAGDPASIGHRMIDDSFGRPTLPACGLSSDGLFFRRDHDWEQVPERQRCRLCGSQSSSVLTSTSSLVAPDN